MLENFMLAGFMLGKMVNKKRAKSYEPVLLAPSYDKIVETRRRTESNFSEIKELIKEIQSFPVRPSDNTVIDKFNAIYDLWMKPLHYDLLCEPSLYKGFYSPTEKLTEDERGNICRLYNFYIDARERFTEHLTSDYQSTMKNIFQRWRDPEKVLFVKNLFEEKDGECIFIKFFESSKIILGKQKYGDFDVVTTIGFQERGKILRELCDVLQIKDETTDGDKKLDLLDEIENKKSQVSSAIKGSDLSTEQYEKIYDIMQKVFMHKYFSEELEAITLWNKFFMAMPTSAKRLFGGKFYEETWRHYINSSIQLPWEISGKCNSCGCEFGESARSFFSNHLTPPNGKYFQAWKICPKCKKIRNFRYLVY